MMLEHGDIVQVVLEVRQAANSADSDENPGGLHGNEWGVTVIAASVVDSS